MAAKTECWVCGLEPLAERVTTERYRLVNGVWAEDSEPYHRDVRYFCICGALLQSTDEYAHNDHDRRCSIPPLPPPES